MPRSSALLVALALTLTVPATVAAQATPERPPAAQEDENHVTGWKELDEFHETMAAAWHPVVRQNDLAPARQHAATLLVRARAWLAVAVPSKCDTPEIRSAMRDVLTHSERLARLVSERAADAEVRAAIKDAHDRFHVVEEHCHP
jgi:hypothetical protein